MLDIINANLVIELFSQTGLGSQSLFHILCFSFHEFVNSIMLVKLVSMFSY